ncbi:MAG: fibronectin type III domain-containing protein [Lachnospiraceae bacterium]|nr:fibronectin type III domain-containing protein [Lachnospiraceae bacterium]
MEDIESEEDNNVELPGQLSDNGIEIPNLEKQKEDQEDILKNEMKVPIPAIKEDKDNSISDNMDTEEDNIEDSSLPIIGTVTHNVYTVGGGSNHIAQKMVYVGETSLEGNREITVFPDVVAGQPYVLLVLKDTEVENLLSSDNLLYIEQQIADDNNQVSFSYIPKESGGTAYCYGAGNKRIDHANISTEKLTWNGTSQSANLMVTYDGEVLEEDKDYRVSGVRDIVNAGTYQITIQGINDYSGTVTTQFNVAKGTNAIKVSNVTKKMSTKSQSFFIGAQNVGKSKMIYKSNNKSVKVNSSGKIMINAKYIGKATITITAIETENLKKATKKISVTVNPSGTSIVKMANLTKGKATITWKKNNYVSGYQIRYTVKSNFKSDVKVKTVSGKSSVKIILSNLKKGKKYYVQIRTYKIVGKMKSYSSWSKIKTVQIKK